MNPNTELIESATLDYSSVCVEEKTLTDFVFERIFWKQFIQKSPKPFQGN